MKGDTSLYRRIELLDLGNATDIAGTDFDGAKSVAPNIASPCRRSRPTRRPASLVRDRA